MNQVILQILKEASPKFVTRSQLKLLLHSQGINEHDRRIRLQIEDMKTNGKIPIQSSEKGYRLITCREDAEATRDYFKKKATACYIQANIAIRNWNLANPNEPQLDLFDEEGDLSPDNSLKEPYDLPPGFSILPSSLRNKIRNK